MGSIEAQNVDSRKMIQNARTHSDHDNLANCFANLSKEMMEERGMKVDHSGNLLPFVGILDSATSADQERIDSRSIMTVNPSDNRGASACIGTRCYCL